VKAGHHISAKEAAARLGVTVPQLEASARDWVLEPTYSVAEVAEHFGCCKWQVQRLVELGVVHGQALHPARGGLWPTFKVSHKSRRIPLSAIERHKRHMARAHDGVIAA
jgi:hypothetical protein